MYKEKISDKPVSNETYRTIFCTHFNISFEYRRSDTCSNCDKIIVLIKPIDFKLLRNLNRKRD